MTDIQLQNLKINIFNQAKIYIENMGEFAPFGSTILNDIIAPVGYYSNEEMELLPLSGVRVKNKNLIFGFNKVLNLNKVLLSLEINNCLNSKIYCQ
ncbi:hypothetical protein [Flavobacterium aestivum]|uniref:hypothetical protein n=1 Tax=Flavobacterium aestivum TaxID=3003257 RepID=UPI002285A581|nr:hypothetical protein [Flavobacterium aestivum]